uniref:Uncharacterized protein n=1 Tax=Timspurckia oligopyrenoides TaxID=708627 RepID=A0A7S0ZBA0_9RHOD|mmetsp:Transcript_1103/g.2075  ORF Transcript_1103/g.2075 Transcript_1103/m.2075 type:complete len:305 (+) Transcript_1103:65-979(+)
MAGRMIANLRAQCEEKEDELGVLLGKLHVMQAARAEKQKELGNLASKWDTGDLYSTEYEITNIVDVHGDLSVGGNFNKKNEAAPPKPKKAPAAPVAAKPKVGEKGFSVGGEEEYAGEFEVPEWAKNETKKKIMKETIASKDTKDVHIGSTMSELQKAKAEAAKKDAMLGAEDAKGKVSNVLSMFNKVEVDEDKDIKEKLKKQREARKLVEEQKMKEKEEMMEIEKKKKEEESKMEEEMKKKAEEEAKRKEEMENTKKVKIGKLPGLPDEEPTENVKLMEYLNLKKVILDQEIQRTTKAIQNFVV